MHLAIIVIYALMGWLFAALGHGWDTLEFWCMIILMLALENATRIRIADQMSREFAELAIAIIAEEDGHE